MKKNSALFPFVLSNFAMTADGKIAFARGNYTPFSSARDRRHMLELRATADAVMTGARTAEPAGVRLGTGPAKYRRARLARGLNECHLRVIVSGAGSVDPRADVFKHRVSPIIILTSARAPRKKLEALRAVADEVKVFGKNEIAFPAALRWLRRKWNVRRLVCEGGGELHDALLRSGLVHELHLTICPVIFGGRLAPTIADGHGFPRLSRASQFRLALFKRFGNEIFTIWRRRA
ncbi:MAG: dihydrofolate reductase family protein [Verrucomicrobia bacterium]|nr:dihydrofolate reductase family protein [Verrucomicrobiota bacterium]MDE3099374.1 dihydrofolate reductase family protein [Verrucomicrobiota bacterium]